MKMVGQLGTAAFWGLKTLSGTLPQSATNGDTQLGSLDLAPLPSWLPSQTTPPWGSLTAADSCPSTFPSTGATRSYNWTIARGNLAPDGVTLPVILANGQLPGPLIEANWGDWIEITVHNAIEGPEEGTAIHWHGVAQASSPWADGVATIDHCPIVPGGSLTYRWRATQYGTSWWHSHYTSQYASGLQGPIVIHGPPSAPYDIDLGAVVLTDWYHDDYEDLVAKVMSNDPTNYVPFDSAGLINGKGYYPCANVTSGPCDNTGGSFDNATGTCVTGLECSVAGLSEFKFQSGKKHLLHLVNTAAEMFSQFSIDNHTMTVIGNDFTPLEPYTTDVVTLSVGQRTDVIVEANGDPSESYWMRSTTDQLCSNTQNPDTRAIIYYENADTSLLPQTTGVGLPANAECLNDDLSLTIPSCAIAVEEPDTTFTVEMTFGPNGTDSSLFYMNNVAYEGDYNDPILLSAAKGNTNFPPERNVYNLGSNATVRLIFKNLFVIAHPMHLHSHSYQILAVGTGTWDGTITNPQNPNRRDVELVGAGGNTTDPTYLVLQWSQDNPGVWPFHCHIAWHLSAGLFLSVLERPDDVANLDIPQEYLDTCTAWNTWELTHSADQLDSGVKKRDLGALPRRGLLGSRS